MPSTTISDSFVADLPPALRDRFEALEFVERRLPDTPELREFYATFRQGLRTLVEHGEELPPDADLLIWTSDETPSEKSYRYLAYLIRHLHQHGEEGRRPLGWVHEQMNGIRQQLNGLRRKLEAEGRAVPHATTPAQSTFEVPVAAIPVARVERPPTPTPPPAPPEPPAPRRSLLEILTDPASIQWFLAAGGGLFVVGLGLLLWSLKVFENPHVVAVACGLGSLGILLAGWALLTMTRFHLAGRATLLLGCLILPLNIWYYSASGLMTENFWIPATACCLIYVAAAYQLRDPLFAPIIVAGIALTGTLILLDAGTLFEVATPAAFLVLLAAVCIGAERAFPEGEGPFNRARFGLAFFYSGHLVLLAGLGLLLGGQIQGVLGQGWGWAEQFIPLVVTKKSLKTLAVALVLGATGLYLYSDILIRHRRIYSYLGALTLLWAEVLALDLFGLGLGLETIVLVLAGTGLFVQVIEFIWKDRPEQARSLTVFGLLLNVTAIVFAVVLHVRVLNPHWLGKTEFGWWPVLALAIVAVSSRFGAFLAAGKSAGREWTYFFATAAATLMATAEALLLLEVRPWIVQAAWLMLLPIAYIVAARLYRGHSAETPLVYCGHLATLALMACCFAASPTLAPDHTLALAALSALATVFYALNALWRQRAFNIYLAVLFAVVAVWFALHHTGFRQVETYTVAVAGAGLVLLLAYRLAFVDSWQPKLTTAVFQSGNLLASLAIVAGALQVLGKLGNPMLRPSLDWSQVGYLATLLGVALVAALLVLHSAWRRWYVVAAIGTAVLGLITSYQLIDLPPWRIAELFAVGLGVVMLLASLFAWSRESADQPSEHIDFGLLLGSLLIVGPLAIAVGVYRFAPLNSAGQVDLSPPDEVIFALAGLVLFGAGFMLRLKAPTLLGGVAVVGNLLMLIVMAHRFMDSLWIIASCIAIGGALLFGTGLILSVYRDWLLALPERIRRREGVWKVLSWR